MISLIAAFSPYRNGTKLRNQKKRKNNETTNPLQKTRILPKPIPKSRRNICASHQQLTPRTSTSQLKCPPDRTQSSNSRQMGRRVLTLRGCCSLEGWPLTTSAIFSQQKPSSPTTIETGRVLKFNLRNHVSTVGSAAKFFFEGLVIDVAGNTYVLATDDR